MSNINIDNQNIIDAITMQFLAIKNSNDKYDGINFIVGNEQIFDRISKEYNVYIVVKFGQSTVDFGQAILPLTLNILGLDNEINITQEFLNEYVNTYNRYTSGGIMQLYTTPSVNLNFADIYDGYRSLFSIGGTFLVTENTITTLNSLQYKKSTTYYDIPVLSYSDHTDVNLNPQPYTNTNGFTKSYADFQTFGFSIATYPDFNNELIKDLWKFRFNKSSGAQQNTSFTLKGTFEGLLDGFTDWEFKCKSIEFNQKIGEIPVVVITFSL